MPGKACLHRFQAASHRGARGADACTGAAPTLPGPGGGRDSRRVAQRRDTVPRPFWRQHTRPFLPGPAAPGAPRGPARPEPRLPREPPAAAGRGLFNVSPSPRGTAAAARALYPLRCEPRRAVPPAPRGPSCCPPNALRGVTSGTATARRGAAGRHHSFHPGTAGCEPGRGAAAAEGYAFT